jgi:hypothetical protein
VDRDRRFHTVAIHRSGFRRPSRSPVAPLALLGVVAACSATPARVEVPQQAGVRTTYERGAPVLHSQKTSRAAVKLADLDGEDLVLGVAVENAQTDAFEISPDDIRPLLEDAKGTPAAATVYSFDQLPEESDDGLAWDAAQAASGVATIPVGGVWGSLARAILQLGIRAGRGPAIGEAGTASPPVSIADAYLSRQTVGPGEKYQGIVFVKLARAPKPGDSLWISIRTGQEEHVFRFGFAAR